MSGRGRVRRPAGRVLGQPCEDLPALRAERDEARADYLQLVRSATVSPDETEEADGELHALERRVYDLEQGCEGR